MRNIDIEIRVASTLNCTTSTWLQCFFIKVLPLIQAISLCYVLSD